MEKDNFLEFISFEHYNELASIANLEAKLKFLQELDEIYQETQNTFPTDSKNDPYAMISVMFLRAHNEFYAGMSQLLKSHLIKAFFSLRIAIESSFNAYYFTKYPQDAKEYIEEKSPLQKKIFWRIKDHISKNPEEFSLAQSLIGMHELSSNFSAHPSFSSSTYKLQRIGSEEQKKEEIKLNYFDELDYANFLFYYFSLLIGYLKVLQLFCNCFYNKEIRVKRPDRDERIATFEAELVKQHASSKKEMKS